ncbi:hypothetical protein [Amycolatopsis sp. NPDC051903]|uniref:hypothetical protein n=1 Tax=Amycolatopsis sp. NPDC051903 TaxID=3363936 RepID=UPI0037B7A097
MLTQLLAGALLTTVLSAPGDVGWSLGPPEVAPGGEIFVETFAAQGNGCGPSGPVTSAGFAAPIQWTEGGNWGRAGGHGTAASRPGTYTATFPCGDGRVATATFTITGTTSSPTPPSSSAAPAPHPSKPRTPTAPSPQVKVRPTGAPQTGSGDLATSFAR